MNITDLYYDFAVGEYPEDSAEYTRTKLLLDYLKDAGLNIKEIVNLIINEFPNKEYLTPSDLPNNLWGNSLIERDKFYFHKELQVISPASTWDEVKPFYLEMKIRYTEKDILDYFCKVGNVNREWINEDKEIGSIKYLLKQYDKFNFMSPVDYLLHLIDYAASQGIKMNSIYDICEFELDCAEYLDSDTKNAKAYNKNKVIWRMDVCGL